MRFPLTIPHGSGNRSNSCGTRPPFRPFVGGGGCHFFFWGEGEVKRKAE